MAEMIMDGIIALNKAKKYVAESLDGLGALNGANCVIKSIDTVPEGNRVTFSWTGTDGTIETSTMIVENGIDGITYIPTIGIVTSGDIASATVVVDDKTSTAEFSFVLPKGDNITVDAILSNTSENPVQNKVIKQAIDNKADKTVATTDTDGLMSAEDKGKLDAFEITKTGGKLHDKDIATTDLLPTELPANGGNADTVDGLHASDFVNANDRDQIQIPNNVDVPVWIASNGKRYQIYMTNGNNIGLTNVPNESHDYVWYWYDGRNIIAREWATGKYYICDMINNVFSGWKDIYTSGNKPYVTGSVSISYSTETQNFEFLNFTPSAVICRYASRYENDGTIKWATPITNGFKVNVSSTEATSLDYIAFR